MRAPFLSSLTYPGQRAGISRAAVHRLVRDHRVAIEHLVQIRLVLAASGHRSSVERISLPFLKFVPKRSSRPRAAIGRLGVRNSPSEDLRLRSRVVLPVLVVAGKVAIRLAPVVEGVLQALGAGLDRGLLDGSLGQMFLELEQVEV